ncbi:uncharacterized protein [Physeter macrocephalus]|uniref:Uncharacterized protein isoform X3 n=1 Tax=Physeter macrocephalus TaxID=9755 RepID=A0A455C7G3_PHYMC|nr:uncharacterized protein LOC114487189 isoform X3 [Physeter catodon]|eukprot:XP_028351856.1 uncharacterized protein LOC114487189 isoform X3 [Physeter catodon]
MQVSDTTDGGQRERIKLDVTLVLQSGWNPSVTGQSDDSESQCVHLRWKENPPPLPPPHQDVLGDPGPVSPCPSVTSVHQRRWSSGVPPASQDGGETQGQSLSTSPAALHMLSSRPHCPQECRRYLLCCLLQCHKLPA